jgi:predicted GIY-YIG superfamily endonuclease
MLRCADGSYYIGHTDDVERRMGMHNEGTMAGYTATRRPLRLVWSQDFATREEALAAERRIKGWSRAKKEALIRGDWVELQGLAWGKKHPFPERLR